MTENTEMIEPNNVVQIRRAFPWKTTLVVVAVTAAATAAVVLTKGKHVEIDTTDWTVVPTPEND